MVRWPSKQEWGFQSVLLVCVSIIASQGVLLIWCHARMKADMEKDILQKLLVCSISVSVVCGYVQNWRLQPEVNRLQAVIPWGRNADSCGCFSLTGVLVCDQLCCRYLAEYHLWNTLLRSWQMTLTQLLSFWHSLLNVFYFFIFPHLLAHFYTLCFIENLSFSFVARIRRDAEHHGVGYLKLHYISKSSKPIIYQWALLLEKFGGCHLASSFLNSIAVLHFPERISWRNCT